jgi:hypothetical protein
MTVTMKEIDEARTRVYDSDTKTGALEVMRACPSTYTLDEKHALYDARHKVEVLLREWWNQGCKEVEPMTFREAERQSAGPSFFIASTEWVEARIKEAIEAHTQKWFHRKY